jgi:hypothetical protein
MKTFIVYDLDSKMPVAVGEQVSAETARYCASVVTGTFHANLFAEEIDLEKQLPVELHWFCPKSRFISMTTLLSFVPLARAFQARCQLHRKRESRHGVSGCETSRSRFQARRITKGKLDTLTPD